MAIDEAAADEAAAQPPKARRSDAEKLAKGAGITLLGRMGGRGIHMVVMVALARLLEPAAFGLYSLGWTLLNTLGVLAILGLDKGVIRYAARYLRTDALRLKSALTQSMLLALGGGALVGGAMYMLAPWLALSVFHEPEMVAVIRWFAPAFVLFAAMKVAVGATRASQKMQYAVIAEDLVRPAVTLGLLVVFYFFGWRLLGAVAATVVAFGVATGVGLWYMWKLYGKALTTRGKSAPMMAELLRFSLPTVFAGVFAIFTLRIDRLLIGALRPAADVGIYQAASQIAILFGIILSAFRAIFMPMIVELYESDQHDRLGELFKVSTKWGLYLSLPLFLVICFASGEMMTFLFGKAYVGGAVTLLILAFSQLINVATGAVGPMLYMTGHQNQWFWISGAMFALNIVLNLVWIPMFGLPGAALATTVSMAGMFAWGLLTIRKLIGVWPYDGRYLKGLVAAGGTALALWGLTQLPLGPAFVKLAVLSVVALGVFGGLLFALGLADEDREMGEVIRRKLRRKGA